MGIERNAAAESLGQIRVRDEGTSECHEFGVVGINDGLSRPLREPACRDQRAAELGVQMLSCNGRPPIRDPARCL
jgi:hypothetical protein